MICWGWDFCTEISTILVQLIGSSVFVLIMFSLLENLRSYDNVVNSRKSFRLSWWKMSVLSFLESLVIGPSWDGKNMSPAFLIAYSMVLCAELPSFWPWVGSKNLKVMSSIDKFHTAYNSIATTTVFLFWPAHPSQN